MRRRENYLIDLDGQVVHRWTASRGVNVAYLLPNGDLLRDGSEDTVNTLFRAGGAAGYVERVNWEGERVWSFSYQPYDQHLTHHDIEYMPNGNVLLLAWNRREVAQLIGHQTEPAAFELLRWPGVLQEQRPDLGPIMKQSLALLDEALDSLVSTREREGARLANLIRERCGKLAVCVSRVKERMPSVMAEVRARILNRLDEVRTELDPNRLEQELALLAQITHPDISAQHVFRCREAFVEQPFGEPVVEAFRRPHVLQ